MDPIEHNAGTTLPTQLSESASTITVPEPGPWRLELQDEIGRGGMGVVYRAHDPDLDREVAVKVGRSIGSDQQTARFLAEARITGQLEHPGIIPVHACGVADDGRPWFSMKLVRGRELTAILARRIEDPVAARDWPLPRLVAILAQACDTVAFAHSKGIIHRDLKPANLMLGSFGEILVLDWGLGRITGSGAIPPEWSPGITLDGTVAGTPSYMPPEQARGERDRISPRSDVFAMGAILFEMLCGGPPYGGSSAETVVLAAQQANPFWPRRQLLGEAIPADLKAVAVKAMQAEPEDRYPSIEAFRDDLQRWLGHRPVQAESNPLVLLSKFLRRHHIVAGVSATALVLLGVILSAGWLAARDQRAQTAKAQAVAERATGQAERAAGQAEQGRRQARQAMQTAERQGRAGERGFAMTVIAQADALFARGRTEDAAELLERVPSEQRDWCWRHLHAAVAGHGEATAQVESGSWLLATPTGFAVASPGGVVRWFADTAKVVRSVDLSREVVAASSDGVRLALVLKGGSVRLIGAEDGRAMGDLLGGGAIEGALSVADKLLVRREGRWSNQGADLGPGPVLQIGNDCLIAAGGRIRWLTGSRELAAQPSLDVLGASPDGRQIAAGGSGVVRIWDADGASAVIACSRASSLAPVGDMIAIGEPNGAITWWDVALSVPVLRRDIGHDPSLLWSRDGRYLAALGDDGQLTLWGD